MFFFFICVINKGASHSNGIRNPLPPCWLFKRCQQNNDRMAVGLLQSIYVGGGCGSNAIAYKQWNASEQSIDRAGYRYKFPESIQFRFTTAQFDSISFFNLILFTPMALQGGSSVLRVTWVPLQKKPKKQKLK